MRRAGDILTEFFRERYGDKLPVMQKESIFSAWSLIVKEIMLNKDSENTDENDMPALAVHSRVTELEKGILMVEADHPGWIQILKTKKAELLSLVKKQYPELEIAGINFRLNRKPF